MYAVIRKFKGVHSVPLAARRAKTGIGQIIKQSPGFRAYYLLDEGDGVAASVMLFDDRESADAAHQKALAYIQESLHDLMLGDPEVTKGEVLVRIEADP